jgi:hypothetical protein
MQPIKYLNGLPSNLNTTTDGMGSVSKAQLAKYDYLVVEDAAGQRQTIPNPMQQGLRGLGFISSIIGAGAKIIGGLINKNKQKKAAAPAAQPAAAASQQPGFLQRVASNLIPAPAGGTGLLSDLQSQINSLQNASKLKELSVNSFIDKQKEELSKQNNMLTQSNAEVRRLLDNAQQMRQSTEEKIAELRELVKAQQTKEQLRQQEEKLKEEIRKVQQPDQSGKMLTYAGIAAAVFFAARSLNGPGKGLSGTDTAPAKGRSSPGRTSKAKVKTVTI